MIDRNLARGVFLAVIALLFGIGSLQHSIGQFSRAGPGLFPLMVSSLLLLIALATIVRARLVEPEPLTFNPRNIALLLLALCGFALVSRHLDMAAGIVLMVFVAGLAGSSYSVLRNLKVAAGLILVAYGFQKLLGLNLPLF